MPRLVRGCGGSMSQPRSSCSSGNTTSRSRNCGLPYHIGGVIPDRDSLLLQTPPVWRGRPRRRGQDAQLRTRRGHPAGGHQPGDRRRSPGHGGLSRAAPRPAPVGHGSAWRPPSCAPRTRWRSKTLRDWPGLSAAPQPDPAHPAARAGVFRVNRVACATSSSARVIVLRFNNRVFEPTWNAVHVDHVP